MNLFRKLSGIAANTSILTGSRNKWSAERAHLDAFLRNQLVLEIDLSGNILTCSESLLSLLGSTQAEMSGKKIGSLIDAKNAASQDFNGVWSAILGGETKQTDLLIPRREGKPLWLTTQFSPVFDSQKNVGKVIAILTNSTEAKAMASENEDLRVCAEIINMTSIVSEADLKGDIVSINEKFIEISKYSREELIGHPHNTTRHPDMPKEVFKELWSTIGRGRPFRGVIKNRAKDGTPYYVDAVIAPVLGENGKPKKYLGVRYDITATEIERQNARGILAAIDSAFSFVEFDTEGNILTANPMFLQLMGYSKEEVTGRHHRMFVDATTANSNEYRQFWKDLASGSIKAETSRRVRKDGKEVFIQSVLAPVKDEMGRVFKIVKIATDVTAEKIKSTDFEEQLKAIHRAQAVVEFNLDGTVRTANSVF